ncbi:zf-C3HC-domain-containing protein [Suhomyces tanzawaensis NRRL Y-17324]|uniref:Zf-C3HC-domain-containing protein n=1 Tax=Suhomyces tanzawaensis NRRL Y-17324 TaxID=984487 RepID=A0A1E4SRT6_9ASCO|nr:zf-C3HC-domain-containing protein [Suhomyces tanzawaensis NRRL Y-17324]ODV82220.1 zf-C3HC-domain-containing protein [Suhomyces tanzawaensis NRRL Y-17324]
MSNTPSTSQVLKDYIDIINTPKKASPLPSASRTATPQTSRSKHPDIQYFQRVKAKNHFTYHKSKLHGRIVDKIQSKMTVFDPYNHEQLLVRLRSFTPMNWHVPEEDDGLNELKCARNGWKCLSFSITNHTKNHLLCTNCNKLLVLKFGSESPKSASTIFPFEEETEPENEEELNRLLKQKYLQQIVIDGHSSGCSWRNFETPLEGIYYLRPYINITNELLINDYLKNLKNLIDNWVVLSEFKEYFEDSFVASSADPAFLKISNQWLLQRYFKENKENLSILLEMIPSWIYTFSMLGWALNVQTFSDQVILLLICNKCNQRIFLNLEKHSSSPQPYLHLSSSKILTPCKYPIPNPQLPGYQDEQHEETVKFNPYTEHKDWCCNVHRMTTSEVNSDLKIHQYFHDMFLNSKSNIGPNGEYVQADEDLSMDCTESLAKRRKSFDINEGIEKLNKLRKLYMLDE